MVLKKPETNNPFDIPHIMIGEIRLLPIKQVTTKRNYLTWIPCDGQFIDSINQEYLCIVLAIPDCCSTFKSYIIKI